MPRRSSTVTSSPLDPSRLPEALHVGNVLLGSLRRHGLLERAEKWLPLSRRGGHGLTGLMAFAIVFLSAGAHHGIRPFAKTHAVGLRRVVAAVAGLHACPSPAAISRALSKLDLVAV